MIKRILALTFALPVLYISQAQTTVIPDLPLDEETGRVAYEQVTDVTGTGTELYDRAIAWVNSYYKSPSTVLQEQDKEKGKITLKHKFRLMLKDKKGTPVDAGFIIYSLKIWVRDGQFRYRITDIHVENVVYYGIEEWMDPAHDDAERNPEKLTKIDEFINGLIENLSEGMQPPAPPKNEDDW